jgi:acyl dehydratase
MAHPGFWLAHPDSGVDPASVLHSFQSFAILDVLPQSGVVESQTNVDNVIDRGSGKAALIHSSTELTQHGVAFARLKRVTYVRNGGGFGGKPDEPEDSKVGRRVGTPSFVIDLPVAQSQALLYRLNGDLNPLHSDPLTALKAGFPRPILHGLCTMGVVTHALLKSLCAYKPDRFRSISLRFTSPVFPGETIRTAIWSDGGFEARVRERDTLVIDGGYCFVSGAIATEEVQ